jgi:hypothetical protein
MPEVPAPVRAKFQSLHPVIKDINWLKLKKGGYDVKANGPDHVWPDQIGHQNPE